MITLSCAECSKEFEAQRMSAKFCSANCRVKFNNKLGDLKDKITTADKVTPAKTKDKNIDVPDWVKEIEDYCSNTGILPQDLINLHKNGNKPPAPPKQGKKTKFHDFTQDKSYGKPYSPFDNPTFRSKMKMGEKK